MTRLNSSQLEFDPLVQTGDSTGTVRYSDMLQMSPFGGAGRLNENRRHILTGMPYVMAAHITGRIQSEAPPDDDANNDAEDDADTGSEDDTPDEDEAEAGPNDEAENPEEDEEDREAPVGNVSGRERERHRAGSYPVADSIMPAPTTTSSS